MHTLEVKYILWKIFSVKFFAGKGFFLIDNMLQVNIFLHHTGALSILVNSFHIDDCVLTYFFCHQLPTSAHKSTYLQSDANGCLPSYKLIF